LVLFGTCLQVITLSFKKLELKQSI
jgi:hypothetical protein